MSATWISSLILGLPAIISTTYRYRDATFFCTADFGRTTFSVYYSIVYTTFVFILPLILVLTCNLKVSTPYTKGTTMAFYISQLNPACEYDLACFVQVFWERWDARSAFTRLVIRWGKNVSQFANLMRLRIFYTGKRDQSVSYFFSTSILLTPGCFLFSIVVVRFNATFWKYFHFVFSHSRPLKDKRNFIFGV